MVIDLPSYFHYASVSRSPFANVTTSARANRHRNCGQQAGNQRGFPGYAFHLSFFRIARASARHREPGTDLIFRLATISSLILS